LPHVELLQTDKYWMVRLSQLHARITAHNDDWKFYLAQREALDFLGEFSALYLDVLKDRLYSDLADSSERRSAQTVLAAALNLFVKIFAPVLAFTCEETWSFMTDEWKLDADGKVVESVHLCDWPEFELNLCDEEATAQMVTFEQIFAVRDQVTKALEDARSDGLVGKSQEAAVSVKVTQEMLDALRSLPSELLEEIFIVSCVQLEVLSSDERKAAEDAEGRRVAEIIGKSVEMVDESLDVHIERTSDAIIPLNPILIKIEKSTGEKCPRCWNYRELGTNAAYPDVCARCADVLTKLNYQTEEI